MNIVQQNPILEEGFLGDNKKSRQNVGEMFLSSKAIEKLLPIIGLSETIIINNNKKLAIQKLQDRKNNNASEIYFCYIQGIHAISAYIKLGDITKVFIMDSEGAIDNRHPLVTAINQIFPNNQIVAPRKSIQLDYYSCGTVAVKALKTFKHLQEEIFKIIDLSKANLKNGIYLLPIQQMPADLLKLSQIQPPQDKLKSAVSGKHKTLQEYLQHHQITLNNKAYYGAAISTKYKLSAKLG